MKILKYGEGYPKTVVCTECNSELEYNASDVETFESECIDMVNNKVQAYRRSYIFCPVCERIVDLGKDVLFEYELPPSSDTKPTQKKRWWQR
jgi:uncharacterized protein with PIN domain